MTSSCQHVHWIQLPCLKINLIHSIVFNSNAILYRCCISAWKKSVSAASVALLHYSINWCWTLSLTFEVNMTKSPKSMFSFIFLRFSTKINVLPNIFKSFYFLNKSWQADVTYWLVEFTLDYVKVMKSQKSIFPFIFIRPFEKTGHIMVCTHFLRALHLHYPWSDLPETIQECSVPSLDAHIFGRIILAEVWPFVIFQYLVYIDTSCVRCRRIMWRMADLLF